MAPGPMPAINPKGGSFVLLSNSPTGQVVHYLFDSFGKPVDEGGGHGPGIAPHIKNYIIYSEFPEARAMERFTGQERALMTSDWSAEITALQKIHVAGS